MEHSVRLLVTWIYYLPTYKIQEVYQRFEVCRKEISRRRQALHFDVYYTLNYIQLLVRPL